MLRYTIFVTSTGNRGIHFRCLCSLFSSRNLCRSKFSWFFFKSNYIFTYQRKGRDSVSFRDQNRKGDIQDVLMNRRTIRCAWELLCVRKDCLPSTVWEAKFRERRKTFMVERIALKVEEAAEYTGIGRNTMRNLIKAKKLPILRVGTKHLIRIDVLKEFLKQNEGIDLRNIDSVKAVR